MFLLLGFLVPFAPEGPDRHLAVNAIVAGVYLPCRSGPARSSPCGAGRRSSAGSTGAAADSRGPPPRAQVAGRDRGHLRRLLDDRRDAVRRHQRRRRLGGERRACTMLLGGVTTCAVGYLLMERIIRPDHRARAAGARRPTARARRRGPAGYGLVLGTGVPLLGMLIAAAGWSTPVRTRRGWPRRSRSWRRRRSSSARSRSRSRRARSLSRSRACGGRWRAWRRATSTPECPVDDGSEVGLLAGRLQPHGGGPARARAAARPVRPPGRAATSRAGGARADGDVELGGEVRDVAVLFVDIVGSTAMAARRPPDRGRRAAERVLPARRRRGRARTAAG